MVNEPRRVMLPPIQFTPSHDSNNFIIAVLANFTLCNVSGKTVYILLKTGTSTYISVSLGEIAHFKFFKIK